MSNLKTKLVLCAFLLLPVAYLAGNENGMKLEEAAMDQQAFDAYVHFAKPFQAQTHKHAKKAKADDLFAKAGF